MVKMSNLGKEYWYKTAPPSGQAHAAQTGFHYGLLPGSYPIKNYTLGGAVKSGARTVGQFLGCTGILTLAVLVLFTIMWVAIGHPGLTVFDDGGFGLGDWPFSITGCLPWAVCAIGG